MYRRIFASAAVPLLALASFLPSAAQTDPNDPYGRGTQRGIQEMNTSGQVGTVTLFRRGGKTLVDLEMHGVPAGKVEAASIVRLQDCANASNTVAAYSLADLRNARSSTLVAAALEKLMSNNYAVLIGSKEKQGHLFACGHLFH